MPQRQLPIFPVGSTAITHDLAFENRAGQVTYFYGTLPIFSHAESDTASFKMITAQFYIRHSSQLFKILVLIDFSFKTREYRV